MQKANNLAKGQIIIYNNEPYKVIDLRLTMAGRGSNYYSTKLRNILTGTQAEHRFKADDKMEKAFIERRVFEYLYAEGEDYWFMDQENFEQISMKSEEIEDVIGYLIPNSKVNIQLYNSKPIGCEPETTIKMVVVETEPGIKGATISGNVTKPATMETGLIVQVPMFIEQDETIIVNTTTGEYSGRPGK